VDELICVSSFGSHSDIADMAVGIDVMPRRSELKASKLRTSRHDVGPEWEWLRESTVFGQSTIVYWIKDVVLQFDKECCSRIATLKGPIVCSAVGGAQKTTIACDMTDLKTAAETHLES